MPAFTYFNATAPEANGFHGGRYCTVLPPVVNFWRRLSRFVKERRRQEIQDNERRLGVDGRFHVPLFIDFFDALPRKNIFQSRLFETQHPFKKGHLGIQKFNIISLRTRVESVPLGGINEKNLNKMNTVMSGSFACLSAIKKKPAKIINRLF